MQLLYTHNAFRYRELFELINIFHVIISLIVRKYCHVKKNQSGLKREMKSEVARWPVLFFMNVIVCREVLNCFKDIEEDGEGLEFFRIMKNRDKKAYKQLSKLIWHHKSEKKSILWPSMAFDRPVIIVDKNLMKTLNKTT